MIMAMMPPVGVIFTLNHACLLMCIICIFYLFCILCNFFWIIKIVNIVMLFWSTCTISNICFFKFLPVFKFIFSFQDILAILNTGESSYVKLGYLEKFPLSQIYFLVLNKSQCISTDLTPFFLEIWFVKYISIHDCVLPYIVCTWCNQCIYLFSLEVSWHYWIYTW